MAERRIYSSAEVAFLHIAQVGHKGFSNEETVLTFLLFEVTTETISKCQIIHASDIREWSSPY